MKPDLTSSELEDLWVENPLAALAHPNASQEQLGAWLTIVNEEYSPFYGGEITIEEALRAVEGNPAFMLILLERCGGPEDPFWTSYYQMKVEQTVQDNRVRLETLPILPSIHIAVDQLEEFLPQLFFPTSVRLSTKAQQLSWLKVWLEGDKQILPAIREIASRHHSSVGPPSYSWFTASLQSLFRAVEYQAKGLSHECVLQLAGSLNQAGKAHAFLVLGEAVQIGSWPYGREVLLYSNEFWKRRGQIL